MLSKKMYSALNKQMNVELYSAYLYLSMSSYACSIGLKGAANWFMVQYQEEVAHFMKLYTYINSQGEHVELSAIAAPPSEYKTFLDMFEQTLKHEQFITRSINDLMDLAMKEKITTPASFPRLWHLHRCQSIFPVRRESRDESPFLRT